MDPNTYTNTTEHRLLHQTPPAGAENLRPEEQPVAKPETVDGSVKQELNKIEDAAKHNPAIGEHLAAVVRKKDAVHQQNDVDHETEEISREMSGQLGENVRPLAVIAALVLVLLRRIFTGRPIQPNALYQPTMIPPGFGLQPGMMQGQFPQGYVYPPNFFNKPNVVLPVVPQVAKPPAVEKPPSVEKTPVKPEAKEDTPPPEEKKITKPVPPKEQPKDQTKDKPQNPDEKEKQKDDKKPDQEKPDPKPQVPEDKKEVKKGIEEKEASPDVSANITFRVGERGTFTYVPPNRRMTIFAREVRQETVMSDYPLDCIDEPSGLRFERRDHSPGVIRITATRNVNAPVRIPVFFGPQDGVTPAIRREITLLPAAPGTVVSNDPAQCMREEAERAVAERSEADRKMLNDLVEGTPYRVASPATCAGIAEIMCNRPLAIECRVRELEGLPPGIADHVESLLGPDARVVFSFGPRAIPGRSGIFEAFFDITAEDGRRMWLGDERQQKSDTEIRYAATQNNPLLRARLRAFIPYGTPNEWRSTDKPQPNKEQEKPKTPEAKKPQVKEVPPEPKKPEVKEEPKKPEEKKKEKEPEVKKPPSKEQPKPPEVKKPDETPKAPDVKQPNPKTPDKKIEKQGALTELKETKESKEWMAQQRKAAGNLDTRHNYRTDLVKVCEKSFDKIAPKEERLRDGTVVHFEKLTEPQRKSPEHCGFQYVFRVQSPNGSQEMWYISSAISTRTVSDLVIWKPERDGNQYRFTTQTRFSLDDLFSRGETQQQLVLSPLWSQRFMKIRGRALAAAESHRKDPADVARFDLGGRTPEKQESRPIGVLLFRDGGDDSVEGKKDAKDFARNTGEFELMLRDMSANGYRFVHGSRLDHVPGKEKENNPISLFRRSMEQMYQGGVRDFLLYGEAHGASNDPVLLFNAGDTQISLSLRDFMALTKENTARANLRECKFTMMLNSCFGGLRGANIPGETLQSELLTKTGFGLNTVMNDYDGAEPGRVTLIMMTTEYNSNLHVRGETHRYITYFANAQRPGMNFGAAHMQAAERVQETTGLRPVVISSAPGSYSRTAKGPEFQPGPEQA